MGDRTFVSISFHPKDVHAVNEAFLGDKDDTWEDYGIDDEGIAYAYEPEVNYGGGEAWYNLQEAKVDFRGHHGPGDCYTEWSFVCVNGRMVDVRSTEGVPMVGVPGASEMDVGALQRAWDYWTAVEELNRKWGRKTCKSDT